MNVIRNPSWTATWRAAARVSRSSTSTAPRLPQIPFPRLRPHHSQILTSLPARRYQQQAVPPTKPEKSVASPPLPVTKPPAKPTPVQDLGGDSIHVSQAEQRKKDWKIIRLLLTNIWPPNDWGTRGRVIFGFGLLISGKVRSLTLSHFTSRLTSL